MHIIYIYIIIYFWCVFLQVHISSLIVFPKGWGPHPPLPLLLRSSIDPILFSKALKVGNQDFGPVWVSTAMKASLEKVADGKLPQNDKCAQKMEEKPQLQLASLFFWRYDIMIAEIQTI